MARHHRSPSRLTSLFRFEGVALEPAPRGRALATSRDVRPPRPRDAGAVSRHELVGAASCGRRAACRSPLENCRASTSIIYS